MGISRVVADLVHKGVAQPVARLLAKFGKADAKGMRYENTALQKGVQWKEETDLKGGHQVRGAGAGGGDTQHQPRSMEGDSGSPSSSTDSGAVTRIRLDLSAPEYTAKLATAPIYKKKSPVRARIAYEGEIVITVLTKGTRETRHTAREGQIIITNPGGEEYIYRVAEPDIALTQAQFNQNYHPTAEPGVYRSSGKIRAIPNDTGHPIEITMLSGEPQIADVDGMIGVPFNPEKPDEVGMDRYLIGGREFTDTYEPYPRSQSTRAPDAPAERG